MSALYRIRVRRHGPLVRVVVFHDVTDASWFRGMLELLARRYHVLTPEAFVAKQFDAKRINVLITFDDGYASWTEVCMPIMEEIGVKGIFFANSGLLDAYDDHALQAEFVKERLLLSPRKTLSWSGLQALLHGGHTIGGHTKTHARLSQLQEGEMRAEIRKDKDRIEAVLGASATLFAYPFGNTTDFTFRDTEYVEEVGYTHAFSTEARFVRMGDVLSVPRLCLEDGLTPKALTQWVEGGYDLYAKSKKLCAR
jgi:peptidoglycan/xylan/chitin deacetylase (PgdA/CDA1 family)